MAVTETVTVNYSNRRGTDKSWKAMCGTICAYANSEFEAKRILALKLDALLKLQNTISKAALL